MNLLVVLLPYLLVVCLTECIHGLCASGAVNTHVLVWKYLFSLFKFSCIKFRLFIHACTKVEELCESRGGRPGLFVLMSLTVSVDVKQH